MQPYKPGETRTAAKGRSSLRSCVFLGCSKCF